MTNWIGALRSLASTRIAFACIMVCGLLLSERQATAFNVIGAGTASCGTWTMNRRYPNSPAAVMAEQWVLGFLAGVAFGGAASDDPLGGLDLGAVDGWMDNYCSSHPLVHIFDAAVAFFWAHPH